MTLKNTYMPSKLEADEAPRLGNTLDRIYAVKLESRFVYRGSSTAVGVHIYQAMEHGQIWVSGNGSADVVVTIATAEKHGTIVYANAHACNQRMNAAITDVTSTSIQITVGSLTSGNFTATNTGTTASVSVFYQVIGSSP